MGKETTAQTTARVRREELRAECSRELLRSLARHDLTQTDLANACGVTKQRAQEWCDRDDPTMPQLQDILQMPAPVALDLMRWLAGHMQCRVDEAPEAREGLCHGSLAALLRETSDVTNALASSLADGVLSPAELETVEREANEAARELNAVAVTARRMRNDATRDLKVVR